MNEKLKKNIKNAFSSVINEFKVTFGTTMAFL